MYFNEPFIFVVASSFCASTGERWFFVTRWHVRDYHSFPHAVCGRVHRVNSHGGIRCLHAGNRGNTYSDIDLPSFVQPGGSHHRCPPDCWDRVFVHTRNCGSHRIVDYGRGGRFSGNDRGRRTDSGNTASDAGTQRVDPGSSSESRRGGGVEIPQAL